MQTHNLDLNVPDDAELLMLMAYVDGELPPGDEPRLFERLARSETLRGEMHALLDLNTAFQGLESTPPQESKSRLFAAAGLPLIPFALNAVRASLISAVAAALLTAGFMFLYWSSSSHKPQVIESAASIAATGHKSAIKPLSLKSASAAAEPQVERELDTVNSQAQRQSTLNFDANAGKASHGTNAVASAPDTRRAAIHNAFGLAKSGDIDKTTAPAHIQEGLMRNRPDVAIFHSAMLDQDMLNVLNAAKKTHNSRNSLGWLKTNSTRFGSATDADAPANSFFVELRSFRAQSFPNLNISPLVDPPLNNVAAALYYRLDESQSLGIQLGQEHLLQRFEEALGLGLVRTEQNFLALWYGASYDCMFDELDVAGSPRPYVNGTAALNRTGPMARVTGGLQWQISNGLGLRSAAEVSTAVYRHAGRWFSSEKFGFSFGLTMGF